MSTPLVPPRPSRSTASQAPSKDNMPQVPPRPTRKLDPSPNRDTRSPLNDLPNPLGKPPSRSNLAPEEAVERPPVVSLPSVGQEGSEYASFDALPDDAHGVKVGSGQFDAPEQTRNVAENMPLHAPRASVPQSTAKSRIEPVTRTDSTQAAAAGIGKARPDDDVHTVPAGSTSPLSRATTNSEALKRVPSTEPHPLRQQASFGRSSPNLVPTVSRPESIHDGHEHGIPEIGRQIPLNPMAGDVQAPSPGPTQSQFAPGVGFFNDGSGRAHHRKRSSKHEFGPPGSYGLHGHGAEPHDQFEREWIAKHPEQAMAEGYNIHGPPRPETALTSEQLNKLVNQSSDVGMGTDANMVGTPAEDIAWGATDEYAFRMTSPQPSPAPLKERKKRGSSGTEPAAQSPLRQANFPFNEGKVPNSAIVTDDGTIIHVDPPEQRVSKITGGGAVDGALDLGPRGGNTEEEGGWFEERGDGTPILASDEIIKRPGSAYMQPAVSPEVPHDDYESDHYEGGSRRGSIRVPSRPSSRPNSVHGEYHGGNLHRFVSHDDHHGSGVHTPLEEIEEYEPLIPEGQEARPKPKAFKKRPGLEHHHFPSQDIWEDTPMSLQYQTTVETPEPPRGQQTAPPPAKTTSTFETPEEEQKRKDENTADMYSDKKTLINKPQARALEDLRPGMQRFPSQDIWEDTPDSMRLVTTVSGPQMDETKSPPDDRPTTTSGSQDDETSRATTGFTQDFRRPSIPSRPVRKSKLAEEIRPEEAVDDETSGSAADKQTSPDKTKPPSIPDRPKPTIPARPARASRGEQDGAELSKSISAEEEKAKSPPVPTKAKPAIPARPGGEKIAAMKAGFMSDLNNRLRLGPQGAAPKAKEEEREVAEETTEKAPLADARKSRAKGPARRKPAASPSAAAAEEEKSTPASFSIASPMTLWHIDESECLQVPTSSSPAVTSPSAETTTETDMPALEKVMSDNEERNTVEPPLAQPMSPEPEPPAAPDASLDDKISAAEKDISIKSAEEHEALAQQAVENVSSSPKKEEPNSVEVEKKELAPATSDE